MEKPKAEATLFRSLVSKLEKTEAFIITTICHAKIVYYDAHNF